MVKRKVAEPPAELVAAKDEFRRVAMEIYKGKTKSESLINSLIR